jgi:hypothetical protein
MVARKKAKPKAPRASPSRPKAETEPKFHGRDPSPVLDKYPPKDPSLTIRGRPPVPDRHGPPTAATSPAKPAAAPAPSGAAPSTAPPKALISLVRPFDVDEFAELLGETTIQLEVPRDELAEVLRRVCDFMGFGIYVYSVKVRPAKEELLSRFVLELQRVDFDGTTGDWVAFEEKGRSDSPFGPSGHRT